MGYWSEFRVDGWGIIHRFKDDDDDDDAAAGGRLGPRVMGSMQGAQQAARTLGLGAIGTK